MSDFGAIATSYEDVHNRNLRLTGRFAPVRFRLAESLSTGAALAHLEGITEPCGSWPATESGRNNLSVPQDQLVRACVDFGQKVPQQG